MSDDVTIAFLASRDADDLVRLVEEVYGDTYDAEWVYQAQEIARRIDTGELVSIVGRDPNGRAIGHMALMIEPDIHTVVHAGVAVVSEAARGQHLFTRMKRYGAEWASKAGYLGIFSEATAAHPYSQRANVDLGAAETGFLLGWIPNSVANNAAAGRQAHRESVALFYLRTNEGPDRPVFSPTRHRAAIETIIAATGIHGRVSVADPDTEVPEQTQVVAHAREDHNLAIITVLTPGADLLTTVTSLRDRLVHDEGRDAVYVDLPLDDAATELILDAIDDDFSFGFAGVFPNQHTRGDVLRLQSLHRVAIHAKDIATASPHGAELLAYVVDDLKRTHANH